MKRILALVLALTMCLSLAACGSSDETTPTDTNQTDNTTTTPDETGDNTNRDDMTVILGAEFTTLDPQKLSAVADINFCHQYL